MEIPTPESKLNAKVPDIGESLLSRCVRILGENHSQGASPSIPPDTPDEEIDDAIEKLTDKNWKCDLSVSHEDHASDGRKRWRTLVITA